MKNKIFYNTKIILEIIGGKLYKKSYDNQIIEHLLTDSRKLVFPKTTVFFAIKTEKNNGHKYIKELIDKGVKNFIVSEIPSHINNKNHVNFIKVDDTLESLQKIAGYHRKQFEIPVIAITGSNGKTIIKEWLGQLLSDDKNIVRNPKSYNSQIGVPLSVWQINGEYDIGIFEAGISKKNEMQKLQNIIAPSIGIFSNIGPAHDEGFQNRKEKIREKLKLFNSANTLIYCKDHSDIDKEIKNWSKANKTVKLFSWSKKTEGDLQIISKRISKNSTILNLKFKNDEFQIKIPFRDYASIENAIHCIALMLLLNYKKKSIIKGVEKIQQIAMRMELKHGINNCTIINDSYNSDFYSLKMALDFLATQHQNEKKILILSDIQQSGIDDKVLYNKVSKLLNEKGISQFIGVGERISHYPEFFNDSCHFYKNTEDLLRNHNFQDFNDSAILIKGARAFGFEKIANSLQLKDHQTILEINLDSMVHNLNVFRSFLKPGVKSMIMVKAFGYGSGSSEIANILQYHNVDYLTVAYTDEGKELRKSGINTPIMVMNPEAHSFDGLIKYNLEPEVYNFRLLYKIIEEAKQNPKISLKNPLYIHIKLDTGMHRLGFDPDDINKITSILNKTKLIKIKSVFSHLAASDNKEFDNFTKKQINIFIDSCKIIKENIVYGFLKHICNSAAITRFPEAQIDMVRLGIGLYGISNNENVKPLLKNVSTFKSIISQIKKVKKGEAIGYNLEEKLSKNKTIGIIPVGYADGLNRKLGNKKGTLVINGKRAEIIGNICMDMCIVDLTNIKAKEGDEVIIFGENNPIEKIANTLDTIPYEILTSVSSRVKRVYYYE